MKDFFRNNGFLILIAALLLAAVTAVGSYVLQGVPNPLENILGVVTTPVRNGISALAGWAEGIYNYSFHYDELQAENERLRSELARLQESARDAEAAVKEKSCWASGSSAGSSPLNRPPSPAVPPATGPPP